jgi:hypothetical protein
MQEGMMVSRATRLVLLVLAVAAFCMHVSDARLAEAINPGGIKARTLSIDSGGFENGTPFRGLKARSLSATCSAACK